jgi:hypothetical protein
MCPRPRFPVFLRLSVLAVLAAVCALSARGAQAQEVVDAGTFSLFVDGVRVGREDFSIRGSRGGQRGDLVAQATRLEGDERRTVVLSVDSLGVPQRLQLEESDATARVLSVVGERDRGIWSSRVVRARGESAREARLPADTFVAEPGVIHHLWFLVRHGEGREITMFAASTSARRRVVVEEQAPDRVALGLREILARRWLLRDAVSGEVVWEVWTDSGRRLLRALDGSGSTEALRDDPPSETPGPGGSYVTTESFLITNRNRP